MSNNSKLETNNALGVVGGGQLAKMLVQAAKLRGIDVIVQSANSLDPAVLLADEFIHSDVNDIEALRDLCIKTSCITFENEWINTDKLKGLEDLGNKFIPSISNLEPLVNKISQRQLIHRLRFPSPNWIPLSSIRHGDFSLPDGFTFPLMAKASKGGYDGKGTRVIATINELKSLYESVDIENWLLESWVEYDKELAIVASRDYLGRVKTFPLVETYQYQQVCDWVYAPADVKHEVEMMAYNIAASLLNEINYIGIIAIEFFFGAYGLQINEIAPRTHNSAHYTIEACNSSQFDHQICIASGLEVPDTELNSPGAIMINLLGLSDSINYPLDVRLAKLKELANASIHWYGKEKEEPGRKLGHVTFLLTETTKELRRKEANFYRNEVRTIWPLFCTEID